MRRECGQQQPDVEPLHRQSRADGRTCVTRDHGGVEQRVESDEDRRRRVEQPFRHRVTDRQAVRLLRLSDAVDEDVRFAARLDRSHRNLERGVHAQRVVVDEAGPDREQLGPLRIRARGLGVDDREPRPCDWCTLVGPGQLAQMIECAHGRCRQVVPRAAQPAEHHNRKSRRSRSCSLRPCRRASFRIRRSSALRWSGAT